MKHLWLILLISFEFVWAQELNIKMNDKTAIIAHNQLILIVSQNYDDFIGRFQKIEDDNIISNGEVISIDKVQQDLNESNQEVKEINITEENVNEKSDGDDIDSDSDSDDSDSDDSDDDEGNGEPLVIIKSDENGEKDQQNLLDIQDLVETVETTTGGLEKETEEKLETPLPPNLKKLTVVQLKDLVMERNPNMSEETVSKMKKKELLGILKA